MHNHGPLEQVLVIDPDPIHAASLKEALERAECRVSIQRDHRTAIDALKVERVDTVVVVARSQAWWKSELRLLWAAISGSERLPEILCLLRWPSGGRPDDRLFGDQLKVRVLHEA
jgi:DNA-binding NtrC family response regulator